METINLAITGMTCASCAARIEKALGKAGGVAMARVNLASEQASIAVQEGTSPENLIAIVEKAGYGAKEITAADAPSAAEDEELARQSRHDFKVFAISALLTLPLLAQMIGPFLGAPLMMPPYVQLMLAAPVQFWAGMRFYRSAWRALKGFSGNMDLLVALGTSAAFGLSFFNTLSVAGVLYYEAGAAVITLILLGRWLESRAKRGATAAIRALMSLRPETALVVRGETEVEIPISMVKSGDLARIKPGSRVPVDGLIVEGESHLDESLITGESMPVYKGLGSAVTGGSINGEGMLLIRATTVGAESVLSRIIALVQGAQGSKAPAQRLVDRISAIFVPAVMGFSLLTFIWWMLEGGSVDQAIINAVTVLVIACPCALGLATPAAIMVGTGGAASAGILIKDAEALEHARRITTVVFDKTGTLTEGRPTVGAARAAEGHDEDELIRLSASAQQGSEHPLAKAVLAQASAKGLQLSKPNDFKAIPGLGLSAMVDGQQIMIGSRRLMAKNNVVLGPLEKAANELEEQGMTVMWTARQGAMMGLIAASDKIKPGAAKAAERLAKGGIKTVMLTGDNERAALAIARQAGISSVIAEVTPERKAEAIKALKAKGETVAMAGDGVNDAPALAEADIGFAMGQGTDVAMHTAGITLMRGEPNLVADAISISKATSAKIKQNLFWAFFYNIIALPLAAMGILSPIIAGAAMAFSSLSVVSNSLLLKRWRPAAGGKS